MGRQGLSHGHRASLLRQVFIWTPNARPAQKVPYDGTYESKPRLTVGRGSSGAATYRFDQTVDVFVATAVQRRGWAVVKRDQKPDRERARAIKARQRAIGRELRRMYDDVAQESVPDEFLDLLHKMDQQDEGSGS
jgi:hypothetical protein